MSEPEDKVLYIRVPAEYHARVLELAKRNRNRTYTDYIIRLLEREFDRDEKPGQGASYG